MRYPSSVQDPFPSKSLAKFIESGFTAYPDVISVRPFLMSNTDDNGALNDDHLLDESLEEGDFLNDSGESEDKNMLVLSDPGTVNVSINA